MREIRFRGRRKAGQEWLYGDLNHINGGVFIFPRTKDAPLNSPDWFEVDPETVGQFTGLHDKNGKEIYEGDILRILYTDWASKDASDLRTLEQYKIDKSTNGYVGWNEYSTGWVIMVKSRHSVNEKGTVMSSIIHGTHGFREVMGNVHSNPELL